MNIQSSIASNFRSAPSKFSKLPIEMLAWLPLEPNEPFVTSKMIKAAVKENIYIPPNK